jgi:hypothetical protein
MTLVADILLSLISLLSSVKYIVFVEIAKILFVLKLSCAVSVMCVSVMSGRDLSIFLNPIFHLKMLSRCPCPQCNGRLVPLQKKLTQIAVRHVFIDACIQTCARFCSCKSVPFGLETKTVIVSQCSP